jgi:alpha-beta hydrolase superfamily lysophospholipase
MGLITEHDDATNGYEAVELPPDPVSTAGLTGAMFRRTSTRPSRRAVLYLHCQSDPFVPEDLASWYTERGFHFYVADLRPADQQDRQDRQDRQAAPKRQRGKELQACFAGLDSACAYLREADGIDALIVSAHAAGAGAAALWCDARGDSNPADALILSNPVFGRRKHRPLAITCPVLVLSASGDPDSGPAKGARSRAGLRHRASPDNILLGTHVTCLRLDDSLLADTEPTAADRRRFFDEVGRWLGAYMYGQVRDQLL